MYLEVRTDNKKKKYYLVHSVRQGDKVRKIRAYLGIDLSKKYLEEKKKSAENIIKKQIQSLTLIKDPYITILSSEELNELKILEAGAKIKVGHLTDEEWLKFTEAFTYDTNAIEGSTVTETEVKDILERNKHPDYRSDWEITETHGLAEAVKYIRKATEHISLKLIKELHKLCFKDSKSFAGQFRKIGQEVVVVDSLGRIVHRGAPARDITKLLTDLIEWYNKNKYKYSPIILAAVVHNRFENIHPFADGNGRVGRLLLNNILLRHNKPPLNIELKNRQEYYLAIRAYEHEGNLRPMIDLILKKYKEA